MKSVFAIFVFLLTICQFGIAQYDSFDHEGYERTYLVHLPENYDNSIQYPVVIAMHGGFGSADNLQNQSTLSEKADDANFIVVYPEGVKGGILNIRTWNAGWCCGNATNEDIDDVGFIDRLLDTLIHDFAVDTNMIYATGISNGGMMSYRLACELSNRIAAIAPVAASMVTYECNPDRPVPIIHFQSYLDTNVPYLGGMGTGTSSHYNPPLDSIFDVWSSYDVCISENDTLSHTNEFTYVQWSDCSCNTTIDYYISQDGGHSWPGGTKTIIGDDVSEFINANDLMWDFFQKHSLACNSSTNNLFIPSANDIEVFPNPSHDIFYLEIPETYDTWNVRIYDLNGKLVKDFKKTTEIDLSCLAPNCYVLIVDTDKIRSVQKIVVQ